MQEAESSEQFLAGGGEMGKLIRSMDWSKTALGPIADWPQSLRTSVSLCLSSTFPILIAWGPETIQIYNDSYRPICGAKHPESMGQNFRICWETALSVVGDAFTRGQQGEGTYIKDQRMFLDRYGYLEEAFMTFSFAPIRDESGQVGGIFHPITETTDKMLSARRTQVLRDVAALTSQAKTNADIYTSLVQAQADFAFDLPFLLFYELDAQSHAHLVEHAGLWADVLLPTELQEFDVATTEWLADLSAIQAIDQLAQRLGSIASGPYPEVPHAAVRMPILRANNEEPIGFLLAGVSPYRELDQDYLNFYVLLANSINTAFSNVHAYQQEQQRAEALAAIDRTKTAFFSNISHEFRTPLTLMLGPLEELLQDASLQTPVHKEPLEATHRNAMRLLKLVNNLLDFSRIEAGRVQARFQAVDLVALTTDLTSSFRSLIERGGLTFGVACQPLPSEVYVDPEMWEKIVLNLLSNAFKYTLHGSIRVDLQAEDGQAVVRVSDTGIGIPEREIPHMFERFHRVENAGGRTYEGSGIGLSLVAELARLHGGTIAVSSIEGEGSTFTVHIPMGKAHLPASQLIEGDQERTAHQWTDSFLKEARTMLAGEKQAALVDEIAQQAMPSPRILVVDDNADMRDYLSRLLTPYFNVHTALNGADAIRQISSDPPQLILSDIMMPVMDGKELLHRLKQSPVTASIPFIFLSARAGQEARIDGLEAGADDYLVKPFSGPELLSKVRTQISLNQSRRQEEMRLRNLVQQAPVAMLLVKGEALVIDLINQTMLDLIHREADVLGKPLLEAMPELQGQTFIERCKQVYQTGITDQGWSVPVPMQRDGQLETGYFNIALTPYYEGNSVVGVLEVCTEVTELVKASQALATSEARYRQLSAELDEQVQQRTQQLQLSIHDLQRSNENLQQFAYIASHDLQEPLRKIQQFGDLLKTHLTGSVSEEDLSYLERMQLAARRMSILIKDLLAFSRIATTQVVNQPVLLQEVVDQALESLSVAIEESGAQIEVTDLPMVQGNRLQLSQLFQNLLSNALKFRRPNPAGAPLTPQIRVQSRLLSRSDLPPSIKPARYAASYHLIEVADNGIGFEEKYVDRIFQVFQRLHGKNEFAGTGVGLAIVEKVVTNHGGAITASGKPNQGATFCVYLAAS